VASLLRIAESPVESIVQERDATQSQAGQIAISSKRGASFEVGNWRHRESSHA